MKKSIKAVIFDMDGVIFDSERGIIECWKQVAGQHGFDPDRQIEATCMRCIGTTAVKTREIVLSQYGTDFPYDNYVQEVRALFHEHYQKGGLPVKKGARELLSWLRKEQVPIALATSTSRHIVEGELRDVQLYNAFDLIVCGDQVKNSKPAPDIFLKAAEGLSQTPADCAVIEDSFNGIRAAHAAGMHPLMVPDILQPDEDLLPLTEHVFSDLTKVLEYLKN